MENLELSFYLKWNFADSPSEGSTNGVFGKFLSIYVVYKFQLIWLESEPHLKDFEKNLIN